MKYLLGINLSSVCAVGLFFFLKFLLHTNYLVIFIKCSEASCAFSLADIQEIDAEVSNFSEELERESGPLILAWAVHLCLVSSLLLEGGTDTLMVLPCLPVFLFSYHSVSCIGILFSYAFVCLNKI